MYPVVELEEILGIKGNGTETTNLFILVQSSEKKFCIQVDELLGQQQVVIKNLGKAFAELRGVSGGAIMADGKVGLILDPEQFSVMAKGT